MLSYQKSSTSDEDDTAVPLGTTLLPPTMSYHSKRLMSVAILAGMMLAGGAVWRRPEVGSSSTPTAAEGLVVATPLSVEEEEEDYDYDYGTVCVPAASGATFGGVSTTPEFDAVGPEAPFETCFQFGNEATYCWTNSYYNIDDRFYPCYPTSQQG